MVLRILQFLLILAVSGRSGASAKGCSKARGTNASMHAPKPTVKLQRDPVCGTFVSPATAPALRDGGETIYFCSDKCRREWERGDGRSDG